MDEMRPNEAGAKWYCLRSQPKREHLAAAGLRQIPEVEVVCPRIRFKRSTRRGAVWFVEAMFPGYLFARFDLHHMHRQVRHTHGVRTIVQFSDRFAVIDDGVIAELKNRTDASEVLEVTYSLTPGENVEIVEGPFRGLEAVITQVLPARERIKVLLEFLGRSVEAEVATPAVLPQVTRPWKA